MGKRAFEGIMAGLRAALAHARGDQSQIGRVHHVDPVDVKTVREKTGLSQREFSAVFRIPLSTLRKWEQHEREPTGPARVLPHVIDRKPKVVLKVAREVTPKAA
jgi:putative transcriptional regulator